MSGPVRIAPSLSEALPQDLVWLDRDGNVRRMTRAHRWRVSWVLPSILFFGVIACGVLVVADQRFRTFGIVAAVVYAFVGAVAYFGVLTRRALERAASGRRSEADAMADRVLAHPVLAAGYQRVALLVKARLAVGEQRWGDAVDRYRAIRYSHGARSRRSSTLNRVEDIAIYEEIVALCNAQRLDDAKDLLARAPRPTGDYLELLWDTARLFVAFTLDDPSVVDARDAQKMMHYARHATGWGVLALVGWHARRTGDEALALRAIDAERSKPHGEFDRRLPAVARWLERA